MNARVPHPLHRIAISVVFLSAPRKFGVIPRGWAGAEFFKIPGKIFRKILCR